MAKLLRTPRLKNTLLCTLSFLLFFAPHAKAGDKIESSAPAKTESDKDKDADMDEGESSRGPASSGEVATLDTAPGSGVAGEKVTGAGHPVPTIFPYDIAEPLTYEEFMSLTTAQQKVFVIGMRLALRDIVELQKKHNMKYEAPKNPKRDSVFMNWLKWTSSFGADAQADTLRVCNGMVNRMRATLLRDETSANCDANKENSQQCVYAGHIQFTDKDSGTCTAPPACPSDASKVQCEPSWSGQIESRAPNGSSVFQNICVSSSLTDTTKACLDQGHDLDRVVAYAKRDSAAFQRQRTALLGFCNAAGTSSGTCQLVRARLNEVNIMIGSSGGLTAGAGGTTPPVTAQSAAQIRPVAGAAAARERRQGRGAPSAGGAGGPVGDSGLARPRRRPVTGERTPPPPRNANTDPFGDGSFKFSGRCDVNYLIAPLDQATSASPSLMSIDTAKKVMCEGDGLAVRRDLVAKWNQSLDNKIAEARSQTSDEAHNYRARWLGLIKQNLNACIAQANAERQTGQRENPNAPNIPLTVNNGSGLVTLGVSVRTRWNREDEHCWVVRSPPEIAGINQCEHNYRPGDHEITETVPGTTVTGVENLGSMMLVANKHVCNMAIQVLNPSGPGAPTSRGGVAR